MWQESKCQLPARPAKALLRDTFGTTLLKSRSSSCIPPLFTSSSCTHHPLSQKTFQQQRLLVVLRSFLQKRLFFLVLSVRRNTATLMTPDTWKCRCQEWWRPTLLWPAVWGQEVWRDCSYLLCLPIFSLLLLFVSPLVGGWLWWLSCPFNDPGDGQNPMVICFVHRLPHFPSVLMGVNKGDQNRAAFAPVLCAVTGCAARKNMDACTYNPSRRQ